MAQLNQTQGCTIAMVLHDLNLASRFADFLVAIRDGKIVAVGTPREVMTAEVLNKTFKIDAEIVNDPRSGKPTCISYDLLVSTLNRKQKEE